MKKMISVIVPCYNEEKSVLQLHEIISQVFAKELLEYDYDIIYVDDYSKDKTRNQIKILCDCDKEHVKAVFNVTNFGFSRNVFSALSLADGDAAFLVFGDLQNPPELLPEFVREWEKGNKVVIGQKQGSDEKKIMRFMRSLYYEAINILSDKSQD